MGERGQEGEKIVEVERCLGQGERLRLNLHPVTPQGEKSARVAPDRAEGDCHS